MVRISNRERILSEGLRLVHERGFAGASVRDIVEAAGVPQGSFTNHFASKEAFGLEILNLYFANSCAVIAATLHDERRRPLARLRAYIDANKQSFMRSELRNGCMYGNFSAEADCSEVIRLQLLEILTKIQQEIMACLKAAVKAGELPRGTKCKSLAGFIMSGLQGAILLGKAQRSLVPVEQFEQILFAAVLHSA